MTSKDTKQKPECDSPPDIEYKDDKRHIKIDLSLPEWILVLFVAGLLGCVGWL
jgi:hypothetical protein